MRDVCFIKYITLGIIIHAGSRQQEPTMALAALEPLRKLIKMEWPLPINVTIRWLLIVQRTAGGVALPHTHTH